METIDEIIEKRIDTFFEEKLEEKLKNFSDQLEAVGKKLEELSLTVEELKLSNTQFKNEQYYQKRLEKMLNGSHVKTKHGIVDIITKDAIYELKNWKNYKQVVGQLKAYSIGNPNKKLCAVFFGEYNEIKKNDIILYFKTENIDVFEIIEDKDGLVELKLLSTNKFIEKEKSDFFVWCQNNIIRSYDRNVLTISEILNLYTEEKFAKKALGIYTKQVQQFLACSIKDVESQSRQYWVSSSNPNIPGKNKRGWIGIKIKDQ